MHILIAFGTVITTSPRSSTLGNKSNTKSPGLTTFISIGCPINRMVLFNDIVEIESYEYNIVTPIAGFATHLILKVDPHITPPKSASPTTITRIIVTEFKTSDDEANNQLIKRITNPEGYPVFVTADQTDIYFTTLFYALVGTFVSGKILVEQNQLFIGLNLLYEDVVEDKIDD